MKVAISLFYQISYEKLNKKIPIEIWNKTKFNEYYVDRSLYFLVQILFLVEHERSFKKNGKTWFFLCSKVGVKLLVLFIIIKKRRKREWPNGKSPS